VYDGRVARRQPGRRTSRKRRQRAHQNIVSDGRRVAGQAATLGRNAPLADGKRQRFRVRDGGAPLVGWARLEVPMRMLLALAAVALTTAPLGALERGRDGYFHTGDGVRYKKVAFINVKVYAIDHFMKDLPQEKSKQAVIDANVDKRFSWKMLRTVEAEKIKNALREAFAKNGYGDSGKIEKFVASVGGELKEGDNLTISYDAATKATTISSPAGHATIAGEDFMRATWSIWFGKIDQKDLGDRLLKDF
jgi:hypothetical protein